MQKKKHAPARLMLMRRTDACSSTSCSQMQKRGAHHLLPLVLVLVAQQAWPLTSSPIPWRALLDVKCHLPYLAAPVEVNLHEDVSWEQTPLSLTVRTIAAQATRDGHGVGLSLSLLNMQGSGLKYADAVRCQSEQFCLLYTFRSSV